MCAHAEPNRRDKVICTGPHLPRNATRTPRRSIEAAIPPGRVPRSSQCSHLSAGLKGILGHEFCNAFLQRSINIDRCASDLRSSRSRRAVVWKSRSQCRRDKRREFRFARRDCLEILAGRSWCNGLGAMWAGGSLAAWRSGLLSGLGWAWGSTASGQCSNAASYAASSCCEMLRGSSIKTVTDSSPLDVPTLAGNGLRQVREFTSYTAEEASRQPDERSTSSPDKLTMIGLESRASRTRRSYGPVHDRGRVISRRHPNAYRRGCLHGLYRVALGQCGGLRCAMRVRAFSAFSRSPATFIPLQ